MQHTLYSAFAPFFYSAGFGCLLLSWLALELLIDIFSALVHLEVIWLEGKLSKSYLSAKQSSHLLEQATIGPQSCMIRRRMGKSTGFIPRLEEVLMISNGTGSSVQLNNNNKESSYE